MHHGPPHKIIKYVKKKKDEQFCCCLLLGIKPRVLYMRCQVLTTPSSFDPFFKKILLCWSYRKKYIAFNVEDWMHIDRVTHDIANCQTENIPGVVEQVPSPDERQLVERVGSKRINCL